MRTDGGGKSFPLGTALSWRDVTGRSRVRKTRRAAPPVNLGVTRGEDRATAWERRILDFLRAGGKYTAKYIADKANVPTKNTRDILYNSYLDGVVERESFGLTHIWYMEKPC